MGQIPRKKMSSRHAKAYLEDKYMGIVMILLHVVNHLHEALAQGIGLFHCLGLAIDADDGLGV